MTFTEVSPGTFCFRSNLGVYCIRSIGLGQYSWQLTLKTNAVIVDSFASAFEACQRHFKENSGE